MSSANDDPQRAAQVEYLLRWHRGLLPEGVRWLLDRARVGALPSKETFEIWVRYLDDEPRRQRLQVAFEAHRTDDIIREIEALVAERGAATPLHRCPKCGGIARTPRAKQCRWCGAEWRETGGG